MRKVWTSRTCPMNTTILQNASLHAINSIKSINRSQKAATEMFRITIIKSESGEHVHISLNTLTNNNPSLYVPICVLLEDRGRDVSEQTRIRCVCFLVEPVSIRGQFPVAGRRRTLFGQPNIPGQHLFRSVHRKRRLPSPSEPHPSFSTYIFQLHTKTLRIFNGFLGIFFGRTSAHISFLQRYTTLSKFYTSKFYYTNKSNDNSSIIVIIVIVVEKKMVHFCSVFKKLLLTCRW